MLSRQQHQATVNGHPGNHLTTATALGTAVICCPAGTGMMHRAIFIRFVSVLSGRVLRATTQRRSIKERIHTALHALLDRTPHPVQNLARAVRLGAIKPQLRHRALPARLEPSRLHQARQAARCAHRGVTALLLACQHRHLVPRGNTLHHRAQAPA